MYSARLNTLYPTIMSCDSPFGWITSAPKPSAVEMSKVLGIFYRKYSYLGELNFSTGI